MVAKKPLPVGAVFGHLTIISEAAGRNVICRCSCGRQPVLAERTAVRLGRSVSCGCQKGVRTRAYWAKNRTVVAGKYGRLTVVSQNGKWAICDCDCGVTNKRVKAYDMAQGKIRSCGCSQVEHAKTVLRARNTTHGRTNTTEYVVWAQMRQRCANPSEHDYDRYGGRGITVCSRWVNSFENFYADMGDRPKGTTLDRINNDGPYSKENCRWATTYEQSRNTRRNTWLVIHGERMILTDAAKKYGLTVNALCARLRRDPDPEKAVSYPMKNNGRKKT